MPVLCLLRIWISLLDLSISHSTGEANIFHVPGTNERYQTDYASGGRVGACVFSVHVGTWFNSRSQWSQNWREIGNLEFLERARGVPYLYTQEEW